MSHRRIIGVVGCVTALALVFVGSRLPAQERLADAQSDVLEEFSISNDILLLPVTVGDNRYSFALDTGCSYSVFDTPLVKHLGLPVRQHKMTTPGNPITATEYAMPDLQVGRLKPPAAARALCASVLEPRQALDEPLDGMIGMDFLRPHIVQLDFDAQKVRFLKSLPPEPGELFPIVLGTSEHRNVPLFRVKATDTALVFAIDTGYNGTLQVDSVSFDELDNGGRIGLRSEVLFSTAGGTHSQLNGRLDSLTVGGFTHRDLIVDRHSRSNVVGLRYLKRFLVTFDFPRNVMYLKPGKGFDQIDEWDLSGLHIWRVNGDALIESVDAGSPAASLGLQAKDVVVEVNGQPADTIRLTILRAMLRDASQSLAITIRRGKLKKSVALKPQEFRTKPSSAVDSSESVP